MSGIKTEIIIDAEIFGDLIRQLADPKPAFKEFGELVKTRLIPEKFHRAEDSYGNKWAALAPSTLRSMYKGRVRSSYGTKPLNATGTLRNSFKYRTLNDGVLIYTLEDYFKYHQSDQEPRRKLPRRPALPDADKGLPKVWTDALINKLEKHIYS